MANWWAPFFGYLLLLDLEYSYGGSNFIGTPPSFVQQPADTTVHETVLHEFRGRKVNLILHCKVTGDPMPTVTWFKGNRGFTRSGILLSSGSIGFNITEREFIEADNMYHCTAMNIIGPNNTMAIIRSRNATVSYAYFNGFRDSPGSVSVKARLGQSVALECAVNECNPQPAIEWWTLNTDGQLNAIVQLSDTNPYIESVRGGRYLYFTSVSLRIIHKNPYTCVVTNAWGNQRVKSGRVYNISSDLPDGQLNIFMLLQPTLVISTGTDVILRISAVYGTNDISQQFYSRCFRKRGSGVEINGLSTRYVYRATDPLTDDSIHCNGIAGGKLVFTTSVNFSFIEPPSIAALPPAEYVKRDIYIGDPPVVLSCASTGLPPPKTTWFYNSHPLSNSSSLFITGLQLTILTPLVVHSGIYQCFVSNGVPAPLEDVQRTWIVEVSQLIPPTVFSLRKSNKLVVEDPIEGFLLIRQPNSVNVTIVAEVMSYPCLSVQWKFKDRNISMNDSQYIFNNPCWNYTSAHLYQFNLTINLLNVETSGRYSAWFKHERFPSTYKRGLYVTIPVEPQAVRVRIKVKEHPTITCLMTGSTVILTCDLIGYPRPAVEFFHDNILLAPAANSRISSISFNQITIENINNHDQGHYFCKTIETSSSQITERVSPSTLFIYCSPPGVVAITSNLNQRKGKWEIACEVNGVPIPTVVWFKDNENINDMPNLFNVSNSNDTGTSIITISSAAAVNSSGLYICLVRNEVGSMFKEKTIIVGAPPTIVSMIISNPSIREGNNLDIKCETNGFPIPRVVWFINNMRIENLGDNIEINTTGLLSILSINSTTRDYNGHYTCMAINYIGTENKTVEVAILSVPMVVSITGEDISVMDGDQLDISCVVSGFPTPSVFWLKDNIKIQSGVDNSKLNATNVLSIFKHPSVSLADIGVYTCVGMNDLGSAKKALYVLVHRANSVRKLGYTTRTSTIVTASISIFYNVLHSDH